MIKHQSARQASLEVTSPLQPPDSQDESTLLARFKFIEGPATSTRNMDTFVSGPLSLWSYLL